MPNNRERRGVTPAKAARDSAILVVTIAIGVVAIAAVVAICVASMSVPTPQVLALGFPISCTMMYLLYQSYAAVAERA